MSKSKTKEVICEACNGTGLKRNTTTGQLVQGGCCHKCKGKGSHKTKK